MDDPPSPVKGEIFQLPLRLVEEVGPQEIDDPPLPYEGRDFLATPMTC
jgi:hypothetical protein